MRGDASTRHAERDAAYFDALERERVVEIDVVEAELIRKGGRELVPVDAGAVFFVVLSAKALVPASATRVSLPRAVRRGERPVPKLSRSGVADEAVDGGAIEPAQQVGAGGPLLGRRRPAVLEQRHEQRVHVVGQRRTHAVLADRRLELVVVVESASRVRQRNEQTRPSERTGERNCSKGLPPVKTSQATMPKL